MLSMFFVLPHCVVGIVRVSISSVKGPDVRRTQDLPQCAVAELYLNANLAHSGLQRSDDCWFSLLPPASDTPWPHQLQQLAAQCGFITACHVFDGQVSLVDIRSRALSVLALLWLSLNMFPLILRISCPVLPP